MWLDLTLTLTLAGWLAGGVGGGNRSGGLGEMDVRQGFRIASLALPATSFWNIQPTPPLSSSIFAWLPPEVLSLQEFDIRQKSLVATESAAAQGTCAPSNGRALFFFHIIDIWAKERSREHAIRGVTSKGNFSRNEEKLVTIMWSFLSCSSIVYQGLKQPADQTDL